MNNPAIKLTKILCNIFAYTNLRKKNIDFTNTKLLVPKHILKVSVPVCVHG